MSRTNIASLFSLLLACWAATAVGAPIVFEDPILIPDSSGTDSVVGTGLVTPLGTDDPDSWDYWLLVGNAGDTVEVTVNRIDGALDPVIGIWDGLEFDTDDFTDIFSDSTNRTLITNGDDQLPPAVPGPFGDPSVVVSFTTPAIFVVAVADFGAVGNPVLPELAYEIVVTRIPEPAAAVLSGLVVMVGLARRQRR